MSMRLDMPWRRKDGPGFWIGLFVVSVMVLIIALAALGCAAGNEVTGIKAQVKATGLEIMTELRKEIAISTTQAIEATNTVGGNLSQKINTESTTTTGISGLALLGLVAVALAGVALILLILARRYGYTPKNWDAKREWGTGNGG